MSAATSFDLWEAGERARAEEQDRVERLAFMHAALAVAREDLARAEKQSRRAEDVFCRAHDALVRSRDELLAVADLVERVGRCIAHLKGGAP